MTNSRLVFRVDAHAGIGLGHLMRSIALAEAWRRAGGEVIFLMADPVDNVRSLLELRRLPLVDLKSLPGDSDAEQTQHACEVRQAAWLAIDGYHFDADYCQAVRAPETSVLLIDDLADQARHTADIVLNQNLSADPNQYRVSRRTELLCGPSYALLRPEFQWAPTPLMPNAARRNILILAGGADVGGLTSRIVDALADVTIPLHVRCLVGPVVDESADRSFGTPVGFRHQLERIANPPDVASQMRWADVAISAAGSTCWELARLGVPMLLLTVAENQRPNAMALAAHGAAIELGDATLVRAADLRKELESLLADDRRRAQMGANARALIDGRGASRVVAAMRARTLRLRPARLTDAHLVWRWISDPDVRAMSFDGESIPWREHLAWMRRRLAETDSPYFLATDGFDRPIGQIRFERNTGDPDEALASLLVAPWARGRGWSVRLIQAGCQRLFRETDSQRIVALVKPQNQRSHQAFRSAGFELVGEFAHNGHAALRYELARPTRVSMTAFEPVPAEAAP